MTSEYATGGLAVLAGYTLATLIVATLMISRRDA